MGAALCAFGGIPKGHFVAAELVSKLDDENEDPWTLFEREIENPASVLSAEVAKLISPTAKKLYKKLAGEDSPRIKLLHLLSRFDLSIEQAKRMFVDEERKNLTRKITDDELLQNPYLIFEANADQRDSVAVETIDMGLFVKYAPEKLRPAGTEPGDPVDTYRIRALTFKQLFDAKLTGHTLLPRKSLIESIRDMPLEPVCAVNRDYFDLAEDEFDGVISRAELANCEPAYQLATLKLCGDVIREHVNRRISKGRLEVSDDWETLLSDRLKRGSSIADVELEQKARNEKLAALKQLAESRISVLIGPAGTGKTTLLTTLASHPDISKNGVLLLAPTGKARVRMEQMARDLKVKAQTLAQYLNQKDRFNSELQIYTFSDETDGRYETVILDEASMLTEEMFATTLECLFDAKRFILVGDHRQLPPIGPGRPFVDLVKRLQPNGIDSRFPKVGPNYAELSVNMRSMGKGRLDMRLAEWFSGSALEPGADQVINEILSGETGDFLRIERWKNPADFEALIERVLVDELGLSSIADVGVFNKTLGSSDGRYFNNSADAHYFNVQPSVNFIEAWQILTPVRQKMHGVVKINRLIHERFRREVVKYAVSGFQRKIPKPCGPEQIVYGDKVINLTNHSRKYVQPEDGALKYLANGEIGIVTGKYERRNQPQPQPKLTEIEFSSQKGWIYRFGQWDFRDEGDTPLELAYALTVHKSQGSEFGLVILVIPNPCLILSRELLYTALTRQKNRVVMLLQGDVFDIKELSSPIHSDTARRYTNLFRNPDVIDVGGKYLEKNLIHQASDGQMVRSKSELLVYQRLLEKGLTPSYERELIFNEVEKLPDFTIEHPDTGETYFWEHCGMMHDSEYVERWHKKLEWYAANEILPWEAGGGKNGKLIVTEDALKKLDDGSIRGALSIQDIDDIIQQVFGR